MTFMLLSNRFDRNIRIDWFAGFIYYSSLEDIHDNAE